MSLNNQLDDITLELWNSINKMSEEEKENWKIESFSHLRQLMVKEMDVLSDLYKPLESLVKENLKSDSKGKGLYLYNEWGKASKKEFMTSFYDNDFFRAVYAKNRFLNSATSFIQALILRVIPHFPQIEDYLISKVSRIISIGVGPGSDIAGFLAFLTSRNVSRQIIYYTMDQCPQWSDYILALDRAWCQKYKVSLWFKPCRFGNRSSLVTLPDADMLVFSFANTCNMDKDIWPILAQKYKLILVLDGIKDVLFSTFEMSNFIKFRLNEKNFAFIRFQEHECNDVPTFVQPNTNTYCLMNDTVVSVADE